MASPSAARPCFPGPGFRGSISRISTGPRPRARPWAVARSTQSRASSVSGVRPSRPMAASVIRIGPAGSDGRGAAEVAAGRSVHRPVLLDVVEGADFRTEDVHHHVAGVAQHPVAVRPALDPGLAVAVVFQRVLLL